MRLLTTEAKTEKAASLSEALASISTSIINDIPEVHRAAPGAAPAPRDAPAGGVPGGVQAGGVQAGGVQAGGVQETGAVPDALSASPAQQDPLGRPVTCGVLCFDEVQVRSPLDHPCTYACIRGVGALPATPVCVCT